MRRRPTCATRRRPTCATRRRPSSSATATRTSTTARGRAREARRSSARPMARCSRSSAGSMAAPTAPGALCATDNSNPIAIPNTVPNSYPHPDGARRSALLMRSSADNGSSWSAVRMPHDYT
eukprot:scaffold34373_cov60-Phaeocystis_antarctica.AAC.2